MRGTEAVAKSADGEETVFFEDWRGARGVDGADELTACTSPAGDDNWQEGDGTEG